MKIEGSIFIVQYKIKKTPGRPAGRRVRLGEMRPSLGPERPRISRLRELKKFEGRLSEELPRVRESGVVTTKPGSDCLVDVAFFLFRNVVVRIKQPKFVSV